MHDGTIADGDNWLSSNLPAILGSPEYQSGSTVVFITWDEGTGGKNGELLDKLHGCQLPGRHHRRQSEHASRRYVRNALQPLLAARDNRTAAGSARARLGIVGHLDDERL
jgi:hypothetical protein